MRRRPVASQLPFAERRCLYCLGSDGPFKGREHTIPRRLGEGTDQYVLEPGAVCDPCNHFVGQQVDAPFTDRFDMRITRGLEGLRDRHNQTLKIIDGHKPTSRLDVRFEDGATVSIFAAKVTDTPDGGFEAEIHPKQPDPPDIVARTIRALWKIALGVMWLGYGPQEALDPRWDHLRTAVLGAPFKGYLLQAPFQVMVTRHLHVDLTLEHAERPDAMVFSMGGVALALPLLPGQFEKTPAQLQACGWQALRTSVPPDPVVRLSLEPSDPETNATVTRR